MGPFLKGFMSELTKLAAFPQEYADSGPYAAGESVKETLDETQGPDAATGLKKGQPVSTPPAEKKRAPNPLTTPGEMVGFRHSSGVA